MADLATIKRPDGRLYRPRKLATHAVADEDEWLSGVIVFGTHDLAQAAQLATEYAVWQLGAGYAATDPLPGWWRDGFEGGQRRWVRDPERGQAGVFFQKIVESATVRCGELPIDGQDTAR